MTKSDISGSRELTDRQKKAMPFIVAAGTVEAACRKAHIARETYYTWLADPLFKAELKRCRDEILDQAFETLKQKTVEAANTLVALLKSESDNVRRQAANDIMDHVLKAKEVCDIEARLNALEQAIMNRE